VLEDEAAGDSVQTHGKHEGDLSQQQQLIISNVSQ